MHGDLRKALKKARLTGQKTLESGTVTAPTIEVSLALALDVAAGMSYIHSMKVCLSQALLIHQPAHLRVVIGLVN